MKTRQNIEDIIIEEHKPFYEEIYKLPSSDERNIETEM